MSRDRELYIDMMYTSDFAFRNHNHFWPSVDHEKWRRTCKELGVRPKRVDNFGGQDCRTLAEAGQLIDKIWH